MEVSQNIHQGSQCQALVNKIKLTWTHIGLFWELSFCQDTRSVIVSHFFPASCPATHTYEVLYEVFWAYYRGQEGTTVRGWFPDIWCLRTRLVWKKCETWEGKTEIIFPKEKISTVENRGFKKLHFSVIPPRKAMEVCSLLSEDIHI